MFPQMFVSGSGGFRHFRLLKLSLACKTKTYNTMECIIFWVQIIDFVETQNSPKKIEYNWGQWTHTHKSDEYDSCETPTLHSIRLE